MVFQLQWQRYKKILYPPNITGIISSYNMLNHYPFLGYWFAHKQTQPPYDGVTKRDTLPNWDGALKGDQGVANRDGGFVERNKRHLFSDKWLLF